MSYDPDGAISVLQAGLAPDRPHSFVQADALVRCPFCWSQTLYIYNRTAGLRIGLDVASTKKISGIRRYVHENDRIELLVG